MIGIRQQEHVQTPVASELFPVASFLPAARGSCSVRRRSAGLAPALPLAGAPFRTYVCPRQSLCWSGYGNLTPLVNRHDSRRWPPTGGTSASVELETRTASSTISAAMSTSVVDISPLNSPPVLTSTTLRPSAVSIRSTPARRAPTAMQARQREFLDLGRDRAGAGDRAARGVRDPVVGGAVRGGQHPLADDVDADVPARFLEEFLDVEDRVMKRTELGLLLQNDPGLLRTVDLGQQPAPGTGDRFQHGRDSRSARRLRSRTRPRRRAASAGSRTPAASSARLQSALSSQTVVAADRLSVGIPHRSSIRSA